MLTFVTQIGWAGLYTINAEIYDTEIRSTGVGWGNASAKLGGFISPALTGIIVDSTGGEVVVLIIVIIWFALVAAVTFVIRETKKVQLEEDKKTFA